MKLPLKIRKYFTGLTQFRIILSVSHHAICSEQIRNARAATIMQKLAF